MGQYEKIMTNLLEKIFKFLENFKPLIDWVRLFLIYQSFEIK